MAKLPSTVPEALGRAGLRLGSDQLDSVDTAACWALIEREQLGRVALVAGGWPRVFPVNYAAAEGAIVFRTGPGAKLVNGPGARACFEVDGYDHAGGAGWSVMAIGVLEDITDAADERSRRLRQLPVLPVAPGTRAHWIALVPSEVTGRAFQGGWLVPGRYFG